MSADLDLIAFITAILTATVSKQGNGVCNSCNCQFNNVQILDQIVDARIANTIGKFQQKWFQSSLTANIYELDYYCMY